MVGWGIFPLDWFVADNFVADLFLKKRLLSHIVLSCLFSLLFSKLTACGRFSVKEIQNNSKRGSPR